MVSVRLECVKELKAAGYEDDDATQRRNPSRRIPESLASYHYQPWDYVNLSLVCCLASACHAARFLVQQYDGLQYSTLVHRKSNELET